MNKHVEQFIAKKEEELRKQETEKREQDLKKRNEHLLRLGLIDKEKSTYKYSKVQIRGCNHYDFDKKIYYNDGVLVPIDVTDEEYAEICKYDAPEKAEEIEERPKSAILLSKMSKLILVLGLISAVVLFSVIAFSGPNDFNPISLVYLILISLTSIITYAFGIAISDIVTNTSK